MSTVITTQEYYDQTVLTGVMISDAGPRVYSVDPMTGEECQNARCVPDSDLSSAEIAEALEENNLPDMWGGVSIPLPIESASEVFLMCSAADKGNRELMSVYTSRENGEKRRRLGTIDVTQSIEPQMHIGAGPEFTDPTSGIMVFNRKPELSLVDVPPLQMPVK